MTTIQKPYQGALSISEKGSRPGEINLKWRGSKISVISTFASIGRRLTSLFPMSKKSKAPTEAQIHSFENLISNRFDQEGKKILSKFKLLYYRGDFTKAIYNKVIEKLATCNETEEKAIKHLHANYNLSAVQIKKALEGAHIWLIDNGAFREEFAQYAKQRISSHPTSDGAAFSFQGELCREALFSDITREAAKKRLHKDYQNKLTMLDNRNDYDHIRKFSWVQLERNPINNLSSFCAHSWDYVLYRVTGKNQGAYGSSENTDKKPLILFPKTF